MPLTGTDRWRIVWKHNCGPVSYSVAEFDRLLRYDLRCEWPRLAVHVRALARGCDAVWLHHWATLGEGLVRELAREAPVTLWLHDAFTTCPRYFRSPPRADLACPEGSQLAPCLECLQPDAGGLAPRALAAGLESLQAG